MRKVAVLAGFAIGLAFAWADPAKDIAEGAEIAKGKKRLQTAIERLLPLISR